MGLFQRIQSSASSLTGKISDSANPNSGSFSGSLFDKTLDYIPVASSALTSHDVLHSPGPQADLIYCVYFLLGAGLLLPWNAFITAVDYFEYLYPNSHIDRVFSVAYLVPCLVVLVFLIPYGKELGSRARVNGGLGLFFFCIMVVPIMEAVFISGGQGNFWTHSMTVFAVVLAGVGDALVQATLVGAAGLLPERYMQGIVSGTGFSGVLASVLRIVTKASFPQTPTGLRRSANVYFTVSALVLVLCIVSYNFVHNKTVAMIDVKSYKAATTARRNVGLDVESPASSVVLGVEPEAASNSNCNHHPRAGAFALGSSSSEEDPLKKVQETNIALHTSDFKQVLLQLKGLALAITLTYLITLSIFPGFLTEDVKSALLGDWYPVLLIASYNVCDFLGKSLTAVYLPSDQTSTIIASMGRLLFFPLFAACIHGPRIFRTETPVFLLTALLGASNGYVTTCFFIFGPKNVKSPEADMAGVIMVTALEVGLTIGSFVGWLWVI